jgi:serine/threonine protein kinase
MNRQLSKTSQIDLNEWLFIRTIGIGLFGKVKLAQHNKSSAYTAVKILPKKRTIDLQQVEHLHSEISIMSKLDHPFIVSTLVNNRPNSKVTHRIRLAYTSSLSISPVEIYLTSFVQ